MGFFMNDVVVTKPNPFDIHGISKFEFFLWNCNGQRCGITALRLTKLPSQCAKLECWNKTRQPKWQTPSKIVCLAKGNQKQNTSQHRIPHIFCANKIVCVVNCTVVIAKTCAQQMRWTPSMMCEDEVVWLVCFAEVMLFDFSTAAKNGWQCSCLWNNFAELRVWCKEAFERNGNSRNCYIARTDPNTLLTMIFQIACDLFWKTDHPKTFILTICQMNKTPGVCHSNAQTALIGNPQWCCKMWHRLWEQQLRTRMFAMIFPHMTILVIMFLVRSTPFLMPQKFMFWVCGQRWWHVHSSAQGITKLEDPVNPIPCQIKNSFHVKVTDLMVHSMHCRTCQSHQPVILQDKSAHFFSVQNSKEVCIHCTNSQLSLHHFNLVHSGVQNLVSSEIVQMDKLSNHTFIHFSWVMSSSSTGCECQPFVEPVRGKVPSHCVTQVGKRGKFSFPHNRPHSCVTSPRPVLVRGCDRGN